MSQFKCEACFLLRYWLTQIMAWSPWWQNWQNWSKNKLWACARYTALGDVTGHTNLLLRNCLSLSRISHLRDTRTYTHKTVQQVSQFCWKTTVTTNIVMSVLTNINNLWHTLLVVSSQSVCIILILLKWYFIWSS